MSPKPNVIQRVKVNIGGQDIETSTMKIFDLMQLAQKHLNTAGAAAIFKAIEDGDHLQEKDDEVEDDDGADGKRAEVAFDLDFVAELDQAEPDEVDAPSADLLSRGEIIKIHKSIAVDVKGFRYDNLTLAISTARTQGSIEHKMAQLVWSVVNGHTFNDGNKRTGELMLEAMMHKNSKSFYKLGLTELLRKAATHGSGLTDVQFRQGIADLLKRPKGYLPLGHAFL